MFLKAPLTVFYARSTVAVRYMQRRSDAQHVFMFALSFPDSRLKRSNASSVLARDPDSMGRVISPELIGHTPQDPPHPGGGLHPQFFLP